MADISHHNTYGYCYINNNIPAHLSLYEMNQAYVSSFVVTIKERDVSCYLNILNRPSCLRYSLHLVM